MVGASEGVAARAASFSEAMGTSESESETMPMQQRLSDDFILPLTL